MKDIVLSSFVFWQQLEVSQEGALFCQHYHVTVVVHTHIIQHRHRHHRPLATKLWICQQVLLVMKKETAVVVAVVVRMETTMMTVMGKWNEKHLLLLSHRV